MGALRAKRRQPKIPKREGTTTDTWVVRKHVLDYKGVKSVKIVPIDFVRWMEITH